MGLQIWLPMNGNLNNYGLSSSTATGGVVNSNGKIGMCYLANKSTPITISQNISSTSKWSVTFWAKFPASMGTSTAWETMFVFPTINSNAGSNSSNVISWTSYYNIKIWDETNHQWFWAAPGRDFNYDIWHHWVFTNTVNGEGVQCKIYIDGNLIGTYNNTTHQLKIRSGNITIGSGISTGGFYINDFRLYDNELDANQIKKISMGLIAHYPLSDRYNEPTTNLLPTNLQNFSMSGYDALSFSCNTSQHGKYTLSGYLTVQTNSDWVNPRITITGYYSDGSNVSIASNFNIIKDGKEHFIETTGQTDTSKTLVAIKGWVLDHSSGGSHKYATGRNFQLEFKDHSTPYTSSSRNYSVLYDVSGYNRNGIEAGTFNIINHSTKHKYSAMFNGSSYITFDSLPAETKTISCWVKTTKNKSTSQIMFCDYNTKLCMSFYSGCIISYFGSGAGTGSKCTLGSEYKENNWNHIVIVATGTNTRDVYVNGVKLTPTSNDYWTDTSTGMTIGRRNTASNSLPFYGYLSDFRAYATALSADDILELYKTPSYLASNAS